VLGSSRVGVEKGCWSTTPNSDLYGFACEPSLPTEHAVLGYMGGCVVICHMRSHDLSTTSPQFQAAIDRQQYIHFITQ
jgi:hypothetical protein